MEEVSLLVIKKDGRRQPFDRKKIISGITKACEKRPISTEKIEEVVTQIERALQKKSDREVASSRIGELVMEKLKGLDHVAYVRFASVYRQFKDVSQFVEERPAPLRRDDWMVHTGGPKVFTAIEQALELSPEALEPTRSVLRTRGNLSSASVLVVMNDILQRRRPPQGSWGMMLALGPGFCSEMVLVRNGELPRA